MTRPIFLAARPIAVTRTVSAPNISLVRALNLSGRFSQRVATPSLFSRWTKLLIMRLLNAIPPTAAERLKQTGRVRITIGLRLHESQLCLPIGLLGIQYRHETDCPERALAQSKIEC